MRLDLRHRLPRLWTQVRAGQVRAWQARKVAEMTRPLSWEACADLDAQLSGMFGHVALGTVPADPGRGDRGRRPGAGRGTGAERARKQRDVWATDSEDGLKTIIARAAAGDAVWFMATINRIAEILAADGDTDPVGAAPVQSAIGIVAQPAEALHLLITHRHDADPEPEPASEADRDHNTGGDRYHEAGGDRYHDAGGDRDHDCADDARGLSAGSERDRADAETDDDGCGLSPSAPHGDDRQCPTRDSADDASAGRASLIMDPPPGGLDPKKLRPRVVLHFHLSDAALRAGH